VQAAQPATFFVCDALDATLPPIETHARALIERKAGPSRLRSSRGGPLAKPRSRGVHMSNVRVVQTRSCCAPASTHWVPRSRPASFVVRARRARGAEPHISRCFRDRNPARFGDPARAPEYLRV